MKGVERAQQDGGSWLVIPVAHLAAVGTELFKDLLGGRNGFASGHALTQARQFCPPNLTIRGRSRLGHSREFGNGLTLAGNDYLFASLRQFD